MRSAFEGDVLSRAVAFLRIVSGCVFTFSSLRRLWGETAESCLDGFQGGAHLGAEGVVLVPVGAIGDDGWRLLCGGEVVCV